MLSATETKPESTPPAAALTHFVVSTPPHLKSEDNVSKIMATVCIALIPAYAWALCIFGWYALAVAVVCVAACIVTEAVCQKLRGRPVTVDDYSAVVTGLLLAAVIPPNVSWWVPVVGGVFAIGVAKHCFGGLGHNIWNPALLARAFLQNAVPGQINSGQWAFLSSDGTLEDMAQNAATSINGSFTELATMAQNSPDVISGATALAAIKENPHLADYWTVVMRSLIGAEGGCIGEVSALALLMGGVLLLATKVIRWEIPVLYIATAGLLGWALPAKHVVNDVAQFGPWFSGPWALHLVGGGLFIGAFFMATDYVTSPMSRLGRIVFGIGCGVLTIVIRLYAGYPEGVCYAILLMNTCVPLIDAWTKPVKFGVLKPKAN